MYTAKADLRDNNGNTWTVTIYSMYKNINEAIKGVERFSNHGYDIVSISISEN